MINRESITQWIAEHGFAVCDDGECWHICIPHTEGYETCTASTFKQVKTILGY